MSQPFIDQVLNKIVIVEDLYHRLILVVGPSGTGKTKTLQAIAQNAGFRCINVNLELSRCLLDLTVRQRALQIDRLLGEIVGQDSSDTVLLDNTEILFDVSLKQDPLRLLQRLSRNRTIIATWNGNCRDNYLTYAEPDHHEYRRYPAKELLMVSTSTSA